MAAGVASVEALRRRGYRPSPRVRGPGTGVRDLRIGTDAARRNGVWVWAQALVRGLAAGVQPVTCEQVAANGIDLDLD